MRKDMVEVIEHQGRRLRLMILPTVCLMGLIEIIVLYR